MKPHRLTIEAIGPYPNTVEVEFDDLAAEGLFLIHGPTGAGKTFLLDAMSFALYGKVPGERGEHSLQSDHADRTAKPRVTLEFSAQGDRYRVERVPKHTAAKQRGAGETTRQSSVSLVRLDGATEVPVASSVGEVAREVEDLVGLDASQFQQVILLPQGRFEQVLRAGSDDRERLLKTLFDTVLYERVAAWLDDHAKSARAEVYTQQDKLDQMRAQAEHQWAPFAHDGTTDNGPDEGTVEAADEAPEGAGPTDQARLDLLVAQITAVVDTAAAAVAAADTEKAAALRRRPR
ncbi:MAG: AAA family ATPase, partial [Actinomycetota bacterium]